MQERAAQDLDLVRSTLRGDSGAFETLVGRYQNLVAAVAWRYGASPSEIEDLVSEVFVKTYERLEQFRPHHPFATWLYRIAVNHVLDHLRRGRRERGRTEMPAAVADPRPPVTSRLEDRERVELLRACLREIAPRFRRPLVMVYLEGRTVEEVSRALGLPSGTVKTRLMRGRKKLRGLLVRRHPEYFGGPNALS